ncbi:MAG: hypothetical protein OEW75_07110 [Cyclobacteriaceae bacterium]|nr:hypothetical protein [Cyclobacteriaceae bacterium]
MSFFRTYTYLISLGLIVFVFSNFFFESSLSSGKQLARELKSPGQNPEINTISKEAPFQYRILFNLLVNSSFKVSEKYGLRFTYFQIYYFYSLVFFLSSLCLFYYFLRTIGFSQVYSLAGSILYLLLPPIIWAYQLPVHTREDMLGYSIFFLALINIVKNRFFPILILSVLGVLVRETLLLLPLVYILYNGINLKTILTSLFSFGAFFLVRAFLGFVHYDLWQGIKWNMENIHWVFMFIFIAFHFMWFPFFGSLKNTIPKYKNFRSQSLVIVILIVGTTLVFGKANEIRLLVLLAPWVIVSFLDWVIENKQVIKIFLNYRVYLFLFLALIVTYFIDVSFIHSTYNLPIKLWLITGVFYGVLSFMLLIVWINRLIGNER